MKTGRASALVAYYIDGWHVGYLVRRGWKWTRIRRILGYKAAPARRGKHASFVNVPTADTKEVDVAIVR